MSSLLCTADLKESQKLVQFFTSPLNLSNTYLGNRGLGAVGSGATDTVRVVRIQSHSDVHLLLPLSAAYS